MKKRNQLAVIIFIGIFMPFHNNLYAQDIEIQFSILYESHVPGDTLLPYLKIDYINKSSRNYYFPALASFNNCFPRYSTSTIFVNPDGNRSDLSSDFFESCKDFLYEKKKFSGMHYYLPLYFAGPEDASWELLPANVFLNKEEHEEDPINMLLYHYSDSLHIIKHQINTPEYDITQYWSSRQIIDSPLFIFLKGHESKIQLLSLSGISGTGIILTICLPVCYPPQIINGGYRGIFNLPRRVDGYFLYKKTIKSNIITIIDP